MNGDRSRLHGQTQAGSCLALADREIKGAAVELDVAASREEL